MKAFDQAADLSRITDEEGEARCADLRRALLDSVSRTGGHLASNLGAVELTVALHRVYDTGRDRLVFDVGHQCYCHKILTGRGGAMDTLRQFGGISGFPKPGESAHDAFIAGHASNSISVATGMARARTLLGQDYHVIALIGDGALTGGLAYEGLSDAGQSKEPLLVILNDNGMSITKNVGGIARHLAHQRLRPQYLSFKEFYRRVTGGSRAGRALYRLTHKVKKIIKSTLLPCSMFEDMGFTYLGPVDGHNLRELTRILRWVKDIKGPVLLHVRTVKGKGYAPAEKTPDAYHGVSPFDTLSGQPLKKGGYTFSKAFGDEMVRLAAEMPGLCAVTAAMTQGTGLEEFAKLYPKRFFDVGIAECHATAMCAGMAKQGATPVFAVYSTFLQRAYDMLLHDVAIQGLHVVFAVDRAGLVGEDGETHQGIYDLAFLSTVPGMTVLAPASFAETRYMLDYAVKDLSGPVAVRYPRGSENGYSDAPGAFVPWQRLKDGKDVTLVAYGTMTGEVLAAAEELAEKGVSAGVIKLNQVFPLDCGGVLAEAAKGAERLLIADEVAAEGCAGRHLEAAAAEAGLTLKCRCLNLGDRFIPHGTVTELRRLTGIDKDGIVRQALALCGA